MTERLYLRDSYIKIFDARVVAVHADGIALDRTAFFPAGGGVLGDSGEIITAGGAVRVVETTEPNDGILHRIEGALPGAGDRVEGRLDWERRYTLMRYHTATHVLAGVMYTDFQVKVTGNRLTPEKGRVDFSFPEFDRSLLEEGFRRANQVIARDLPVEISFIPPAEAKVRPELFKLETAFRHDLEEVRLVDIKGHDVQADGGCHVSKLGEIGRIAFTKAENKGKSNRRVYFTVESP